MFRKSRPRMPVMARFGLTQLIIVAAQAVIPAALAEEFILFQTIMQKREKRVILKTNQFRTVL
jgi:hypothetical protein